MYSAEEVLAQYDAMIHKAANKYSFNKNGLADYEDFVEEGKLAAIKAAQNFDESKGNSFPVYLTFSLNNELRKFAGRNHHELSISEMEFRKGEDKKPKPPTVVRDSVVLQSNNYYTNGQMDWTETYLGSIPSGDLNPESLAIQKETLEL